MRLRVNLSVLKLAYRFGVHAFYRVKSVPNLYACNVYMHVSSSEMARERGPENDIASLLQEMFSSCAVINDGFDVFIDRPSCVLARAQTWSSYKHHNTAKFLIGITPQGTVSFISKGWGGRTSDNFITEHCGLLNKVLLPEYLFLAFRGFDIEDSVGLLLHAYNFLHKRKATADRIGH